MRDCHVQNRQEIIIPSSIWRYEAESNLTLRRRHVRAGPIATLGEGRHTAGPDFRPNLERFKKHSARVAPSLDRLIGQ